MSKFKIGDKVVFSKNMDGKKHNPIVNFDKKVRKIVGTNFFGEYRLEGLELNTFLGSELEFAPNITTDDLKFGDILILRNGARYVFASGYMYGEKSYYSLDSSKIGLLYNDDLTENEDEKDHDIVKVERIGNVIFERKVEVKEMTVEEISKALGYEVKIVKDKN